MIIVGLGGVGMAALLVAVALGLEVVGVDALPAKLDLARSLGAAAAHLPSEAIDLGSARPSSSRPPARHAHSRPHSR